MGTVLATSPMDPRGAPKPEEVPNVPTNKYPNNPGLMEDLHRKSAEVMPGVFDGVRMMLNRPVGMKMQSSHCITLNNNPQLQGYKFGITHIGDRLDPNDLSPPGDSDDLRSLCIADIDGSGSLNANILYGVTRNLRTKLACQMEYFGKPQMTQFTTHYKMPDCTASATFGNVDPINKSGIGVFHYLHKVSPRLSLGAELGVNAGPQTPGGKMAAHSLGARYEGDNWTGACTLNLATVKASYHRKCSENVQVVSELELNPRLQESLGALGFQVDVPKSDFVLRGKLDSEMNVHSVFEKKLDPLPFGLTISGLYNLSNNKVKLGLGFTIG